MVDPLEPTHLVVGPFDMLHIGHVRLLQTAARAGARLVVGVLDDGLFARLLGADPFMPDVERVDLVAELSSVHRAVLLHSTDLREMIADYRISGLLVDPTLSAARFATGILATQVLAQVPASTSDLLRAALDARYATHIQTLAGANA